MKNLKLVLSMLLMSIMLFSCSSNDDDSGSDGGDFMTAKVNGDNFSAYTGPPDTVSYALTSNSTVGTILVIQGSESNGSAITLAIHGYDGPGVYNVSDSNGSFMQYVEIESSVPMIWQASFSTGYSGTLEIVSDDDGVMEGTFSFEGLSSDQSTKDITQGEFRASEL